MAPNSDGGDSYRLRQAAEEQTGRAARARAGLATYTQAQAQRYQGKEVMLLQNKIVDDSVFPFFDPNRYLILLIHKTLH